MHACFKCNIPFYFPHFPIALFHIFLFTFPSLHMPSLLSPVLTSLLTPFPSILLLTLSPHSYIFPSLPSPFSLSYHNTISSLPRQPHETHTSSRTSPSAWGSWNTPTPSTSPWPLSAASHVTWSSRRSSEPSRSGSITPSVPPTLTVRHGSVFVHFLSPVNCCLCFGLEFGNMFYFCVFYVRVCEGIGIYELFFY